MFSGLSEISQTTSACSHTIARRRRGRAADGRREILRIVRTTERSVVLFLTGSNGSHDSKYGTPESKTGAPDIISTRTWCVRACCSSAKRENLSFVLHLLIALMNYNRITRSYITYTCNSIITNARTHRYSDVDENSKTRTPIWHHS